MILEEKKITLKDGRTAVLRSPNPGEGEEQLDLMKTVSAETDFLLRYPEEWNFSVEKEEDWIDNARKSQTQLVIAAYVDGELAGNCDISALMGKKSCHRAVIGIALKKKYWNLGIGSALFCELIAAARRHGTEIMELEFIEGNDRARHLYEKFGFRVVSEMPRAIKMKDGTYRSKFYMQKYMG